ncbi:uncharacterized [Tachysurus ichikawai]
MAGNYTEGPLAKAVPQHLAVYSPGKLAAFVVGETRQEQTQIICRGRPCTPPVVKVVFNSNSPSSEKSTRTSSLFQSTNL